MIMIKWFLRSVSIVVIIIAVMGCQESQNRQMDQAYVSPFGKYMEAEGLLEVDTMSDEYVFFKTRYYFFDGEMVTDSVQNEHLKSGNVEYVYTSLLRMNKVDTIFDESGRVMVTTDQAMSYYALSYDYVKSHFFTPTYIDLSTNQYKNVFFSISTPHTGLMDAMVFDVKTGENVVGYGDNKYDGSYTMGMYKDNADSLGLVRAVVVVGDSITYQDFDLSQT